MFRLKGRFSVHLFRRFASPFFSFDVNVGTPFLKDENPFPKSPLLFALVNVIAQLKPFPSITFLRALPSPPALRSAASEHSCFFPPLSAFHPDLPIQEVEFLDLSCPSVHAPFSRPFYPCIVLFPFSPLLPKQYCCSFKRNSSLASTFSLFLQVVPRILSSTVASPLGFTGLIPTFRRPDLLFGLLLFVFFGPLFVQSAPRVCPNNELTYFPIPHIHGFRYLPNSSCLVLHPDPVTPSTFTSSKFFLLPFSPPPSHSTAS